MAVINVNAFGSPWVVEKNSNGRQVWSSKIPGESRKVWKCSFIMKTNCGLQQILEENSVWEKRLKWEKTFTEGAILKRFVDASDVYDVSRYCSGKILTVAPREFVDLRCWRPSPDGTNSLHAFVSLSSQDMAGLPDSSDGLVRADNKAGCGIRWVLKVVW